MASRPDPTPIPPLQRVHLKHSEVMAAALASKSRSRGGGIVFSLALLMLLCLAIWLGHFAAFVLAQRLPFDLMFTLGPWLPVVAPASLSLVAVALALAAEQRRIGRDYLARMGAVGIPLEREGTYEVTGDALVLRTERMVLAPRWHAIDMVERGRRGWVLSADQLHFLIPYAAFDGPDKERSLLSAITSRLTDPARARSSEAVRFAETTIAS